MAFAASVYPHEVPPHVCIGGEAEINGCNAAASGSRSIHRNIQIMGLSK